MAMTPISQRPTTNNCQSPSTPFSPLAATVVQDDLGAGDQVMDGPGHDDLAGAGGSHDPRGDVDGDAAHVIAAQLDLTDV
jgi:hypothetical protein